MLRLALALALVTSSAAALAPLNTPYPPHTSGSGTEAMSGSGKAAGTTFRPRSAVVNYNKVDGVYVIYLTPEAATCGLHFSQNRLLEVVIVSTKPLIVGAPSLRKGENNYVSVSFKISQSRSFVTSKRVKLVLTRVDSRKNKLWHGRLTVPSTKIEKDTVSFKGTFAARWCGRFP